MSTIIYHNHHIIPKYILRELGLPENWMGEDNLIQLTLKEHCMVHYDRWLRYGRIEDLEATKTLGGIAIEGIDYSGENHPMWGKKHTPETKRKIGESKIGNTNLLGYKHTPEAKQKIREAATGYKHTPEAKQKIGEATIRTWTGRKHSPEAKQKMSEAKKGPNGKVPWNKGMKLPSRTEEHKRNLSEAQKRYWAKKKEKNYDIT